MYTLKLRFYYVLLVLHGLISYFSLIIADSKNTILEEQKQCFNHFF